MRTLYFIAGPNGAGKTTASYKVLPDLWQCKEFVNADEIARGLSPFNPEEMALEAGKLQLARIRQLLDEEVTFSIETTLATRSYVKLVKEAQAKGYQVILLFLYLPSVEDAISRVRLRVASGGHNIPEDVIRRRFVAGLHNLFSLYIPIVDRWMLVNNKENPSLVIADYNTRLTVNNPALFNYMSKQYGKTQ